MFRHLLGGVRDADVRLLLVQTLKNGKYNDLKAALPSLMSEMPLSRLAQLLCIVAGDVGAQQKMKEVRGMAPLLVTVAKETKLVSEGRFEFLPSELRTRLARAALSKTTPRAQTAAAALSFFALFDAESADRNCFRADQMPFIEDDRVRAEEENFGAALALARHSLNKCPHAFTTAFLSNLSDEMLLRVLRAFADNANDLTLLIEKLQPNVTQQLLSRTKDRELQQEYIALLGKKSPSKAVKACTALNLPLTSAREAVLAMRYRQIRYLSGHDSLFTHADGVFGAFMRRFVDGSMGVPSDPYLRHVWMTEYDPPHPQLLAYGVRSLVGGSVEHARLGLKVLSDLLARWEHLRGYPPLFEAKGDVEFYLSTKRNNSICNSRIGKENDTKNTAHNDTDNTEDSKEQRDFWQVQHDVIIVDSSNIDMATEHLTSSNVLAFDCEFVPSCFFLTHATSLPALLQVSTETHSFVFDTLPLSRAAAFSKAHRDAGDPKSMSHFLDSFQQQQKALLQECFGTPRIRKLVFARRGDQRALASIQVPVRDPFVDLQVHARHWLKQKDYPSLASAVEATLGQPLCKEQQCSNWCRRPLRPEQLKYAAADAAVLIEMDRVLCEKDPVYCAKQEKLRQQIKQRPPPPPEYE
ncbi:MAG: hypothetical protein MHM6MM_003463 [Cercozoa sp. M6MM]